MFEDFDFNDDLSTEFDSGFDNADNDAFSGGIECEDLSLNESDDLSEDYASSRHNSFSEDPQSDVDNGFSHSKSEISFGNMYNDRAAKFINDCEVNGVDLPSSIDRSSNDGQTSIDKSIIGGKLDSLHQSGAISDSTYNDLNGRLWSC